MSLFDIPDLSRNGKSQDIKIAKKSKTTSRGVYTTKSGNTLLDKINRAKQMIESNLSSYKDNSLIITDKDILHDYLLACRQKEYISIDTETTGLNPITNTIVGICINTRGEKGAYIPLNHISYITNERLSTQLDCDFVCNEFKEMLLHKPYIDMFNSQFDIRFLRHFGIYNMYCTWDGYLGARLLNENEQSSGLKQLHKKYCMPESDKEVFTFSELFPDMPFSIVPYEFGGIYGAHDGVATTELCDFQRSYIRPDSDRADMKALYAVMMNIEMPCVEAVIEMEDNGIELDLNTASRLSEKYNKLLDESLKEVHNEIAKHSKEIESYKLCNINHKLDEPINIASPTQLATLLYDILKLPSVDKKKPRGTGEEILSKIPDENIKHIADAILKYRGLSKLVDTYIDKLPKCVLSDGRIHGEFNQYGADTGRFSSNNPNLQNIPAKNKDIRKMFKATDETSEVIESNNSFTIDKWSEVNTVNGWKYASSITVGDKLIVDDDGEPVEISVRKIDIIIDKNQIVYYY